MERRGLLVGLEAEAGPVGWGDAAPLPGFSSETLDEVRQELRETPAWFDRLSDGLAECDSVLDMLAATASLEMSSAARFGLETAMLNLWADIEGEAWHHQLGRRPHRLVHINALLDGDDMVTAALDCLAHGYRSIKIKVGKNSPEQDAEAVVAVLESLDGKATLRLDANRAWTMDEALRFAAVLGDRTLDYIEEPLKAPIELDRFADETGLPIALDESLADSGSAVLAVSARAWVLKPTLQGGISGALRLCSLARERGATPVISASFESGVGIRSLAQLAAAVGDEDVPVGLDTGKWLSGDIIEPTIEIREGCIDVDDLAARAIEIGVT